MVVNEVHGGANAVIQNNSTVTGESLTVSAARQCTRSTRPLNATAQASGGSSFGGGDQHGDQRAPIAINEILGDADAHIINSTVTTTTSDVSVTATNSANIEATHDECGGGDRNAGDRSRIGWRHHGRQYHWRRLPEPADVDRRYHRWRRQADRAVRKPTETTAYIKNSSVNAGGGALAVQATSTGDGAQRATVGNEHARRRVQLLSLIAAKSYSAGAVLGDNQILTTVTAYVEQHQCVGCDRVEQRRHAWKFRRTSDNANDHRVDSTMTRAQHARFERAGGRLRQPGDVEL